MARPAPASARAVVIGLDGATWSLLDRLILEGAMPNLDRLRREGVHGPLWSVVPPMTATAWTSFQTGKGPGKHGVYDWTEPVAGTYLYRPIDSTRVQSKTLLAATPENVAATTEWMARITTVEKTVAATSEALARVLVDAAAGEAPEGRTNRLDAVLLLTAGAPVTPEGKREPPQVMQQLVELRNKPVQALIDVIVLGDPRPFAGLAELVDQNAGRFVVR